MARKTTKNPNGTGSIYYSEKLQRYIAQVTIGRDENGKYKRKSVYGRTQAEALEKKQELLNQVSTGTVYSKDNISIYTLAKQTEDYKLNLNKIKPVTYNRNMQTLKMLSDIYNMPICSVTRADLDNFFIAQVDKYSNSCIKKMYALINRVFAEAFDRHIIAENPMKKVELPKSSKQTKKIRALTIYERQSLYEILTTEDVQFSRQMLLSMLTGMRMGEINALTVSDIDLLFSNTITVNKTVSVDGKGKPYISQSAKTEAGTRTLKIENDIVKELLRECIGSKRSGLLFTTDNGSVVSTNQVNHQFMRLKEKYGFVDSSVFGNVTIHSLRHTFATLSIEAGIDAKVLQKILGHTDISITLNTYADVFAQFEESSLKRVSDYMNRTLFQVSNDGKTEQA